MSLLVAVALQRQRLSTLLKVFFFSWKNFATLTLTRSLTTGRKTWQSGVCWAQPRWTSPPYTCAWHAHLLHRRRKARRRTVTKNKLNTTRTVWDSVLRPWWIPVGEHRPCWCEKKTEPPGVEVTAPPESTVLNLMGGTSTEHVTVDSCHSTWTSWQYETRKLNIQKLGSIYVTHSWVVRSLHVPTVTYVIIDSFLDKWRHIYQSSARSF